MSHQRSQAGTRKRAQGYYKAHRSMRKSWSSGIFFMPHPTTLGACRDDNRQLVVKTAETIVYARLYVWSKGARNMFHISAEYALTWHAHGPHLILFPHLNSTPLVTPIHPSSRHVNNQLRTFEVFLSRQRYHKAVERHMGATGNQGKCKGWSQCWVGFARSSPAVCLWLWRASLQPLCPCECLTPRQWGRGRAPGRPTFYDELATLSTRAQAAADDIWPAFRPLGRFLSVDKTMTYSHRGAGPTCVRFFSSCFLLFFSS